MAPGFIDVHTHADELADHTGAAHFVRMGVTTVIATGVSLNVGILGLCLSAADLGYRVVVPTDAVVGVPPG